MAHPLAMAIAPLPVALPLAGGALLAAGGDRIPRRLADAVALAVSVAAFAFALILVADSADTPIVYWFGGWVPRGAVPIGIGFVVEPFGAGLAALSAALVAIALLFAMQYFDSAGVLFHALLMMFLAAMNGFVLTGDLFNLFVFFELMSASAFALCGYKIEDEAAVVGAFDFAVTNTVGAALVVLGLSLTYARTGALNMAAVSAATSGHGDALVAVAFALLIMGYLVKAAAVPFHFWLAEAHAVAPTPICVLFSGVMVEAGLYAVMRLAFSAFGGVVAQHVPALRALLFAMGAAGAVLGAALCFMQEHLKRLLAFSTVAHVGLMLAAAGLLDAPGLAGVAVYVLGHGLVKASLFLTIGIVLHRLRSVEEPRLRGRGRKLPAVAILLTVGGVALAGAPPFATFTGDSLVHAAAESAGFQWLSILFLVTGCVTGGAVLRAAGSICGGWGRAADDASEEASGDDEPPETESRDRTPASMWCAAGLCLTAALALGSWPGLARTVGRAAARFTASEAYASAVLRGRSQAVGPLEAVPVDATAVGRGLASAAAAIVLAAAALLRARVSRTLRERLHRAAGPVLRVLRRAHGVHAPDQVAWILFGVGVWSALLMFMGARGPR